MVLTLFRVWELARLLEQLSGPWGALAGGAIGLAAGLFSAYEQEQDEKKKQQILEQAAQQLNTTTEQLKEAVTQWYKDNPSIGTQQDVAQYGDLIRGYDPNEFVYETEDFDNNYNVNDYYAPNRQAIIDKTTDAVQHTAAGARYWSWYWCC